MYKAEAHNLLLRAVEEVKIVRVYGHSIDDGQQRWCTFGANSNAWYRKVVQPYIGRVGEQSEDGVWEKVQEPDGAGAYRQVVLRLMLAPRLTLTLTLTLALTLALTRALNPGPNPRPRPRASPSPGPTQVVLPSR